MDYSKLKIDKAALNEALEPLNEDVAVLGEVAFNLLVHLYGLQDFEKHQQCIALAVAIPTAWIFLKTDKGTELVTGALEAGAEGLGGLTSVVGLRR